MARIFQSRDVSLVDQLAGLRIDHEDRINRGYVHSSSFISPAAAEAEFRAKNPKVTDTRVVKLEPNKKA